MQRRRLGRTGHESSVAVLGAAAFWEATPDEARQGLDLALARGVNHLDIAPRYGRAEEVVGPLVPAVRDQLFVAGKTMRRNPDGVRDQLDTTRRLLGCDVLDLYQAHAVTSVAELDERMPALETILAARDSGIVRFAGITGHDLGAPAAFREALRRLDLDTVMFPVYPRMWADPAYRDDAEALLAECQARDIGVMAIKAVAWRPWTTPPGERPPSPWYQPHTEAATIARGIRFALSTPGVHAFCTPGDVGLLPAVLEEAERVTPMNASEREQAVDAARDDALIFPIPTG
jgi:aryl-alcohol dehydrogenase-like predicted oxidoreductase